MTNQLSVTRIMKATASRGHCTIYSIHNYFFITDFKKKHSFPISSKLIVREFREGSLFFFYTILLAKYVRSYHTHGEKKEREGAA